MALLLISLMTLFALSGCNFFQDWGLIAPDTPTGLLTSNPTDTTIDVSWDAMNGATSYILKQSANQNGTYSAVATISGTSYTVAALTLGTEYWFEVIATNTAGNSLPSAAVSGTTTGGTPSTVATPTFSVSTGTYTSTQSVVISTTTALATIYYTTDGNTPSSATGTLYTGAVSIASTTTLQAIAYKSGMTTSGVASATYTITGSAAAIPIATFATWQSDSLSVSVQQKDFTFNAVAGHVYAIAWDDGYGDSSGTYTLDIEATAYHADMTNTYAFASNDLAFAAPNVITASTSEVVTIRVTPFGGSGTGTFALMVIDSSGYPATLLSAATPLGSFGNYQSGYISGTYQDFIFVGVAGHTYAINWDDGFAPNSGFYALDIDLGAYHQDTTMFASFGAIQDAGYAVTWYITPAVNEIIFLEATPYTLAETGDFAVKVTY